MQRLIFVVLLTILTTQIQAAGASGAASPYFEIPTPFVVNLAGEESLNFLQVNAQLKVSSEEVKAQLTKHMPAIQHTVMMVLSEQTIKDINSVAGKQKLRETTLKELQNLMQEQAGEPAVVEVYFTGFIIQ